MAAINIAIDGHSSCGKSTLAKALASQLQYTYVDTGAMYRAITLYCLENNIIGNGVVDPQKVIACLEDIDVSFQYNKERNASETYLNGRNVEKQIREMEVSSYVSKVSIIKEVRQKLVKIQQVIGQGKGVVMEGRDIGTVVFPQAELKIFMTADRDVRARRRYDELQAKGVEVTLEEVEKNIDDRDLADSNREENPLKEAKDAVKLDTTLLTQQQQLEAALKLARERIMT